MDAYRPAKRESIPAVLAMMVHALTASGAILAYLAFTAIERGDWRGSFLWLGAALLVDGIDGPLARRVDVRRNAPRITGPTLDLVVDYLTYVFLPMLLILRAGSVPESFELVAVALIQLSSLYHFARTDSKSPDHYFVGFPALWNLVAFYLVMIRPDPVVGALVVGAFAALTFAPVYFVHPVRVRAFRPFLPIVGAAWTISSLALFWPSWSPPASRAWLGLSLLSAAVLLVLGLIRTFRGPMVGATAIDPATPPV